MRVDDGGVFRARGEAFQDVVVGDAETVEWVDGHSCHQLSFVCEDGRPVGGRIKIDVLAGEEIRIHAHPSEVGTRHRSPEVISFVEVGVVG